MHSLKHLTICLLLLALPLSNVAGWFHVGCCQPVEQAAAQSDSSQAATCCCQHECHRPNRSEQGPTNDESRPEHDSDSCSICQKFFSSRFSILSSVEAFVWAPLAIARMDLQRDNVSIEAVYLRSLAARGPPNASMRLFFVG